MEYTAKISYSSARPSSLGHPHPISILPKPFQALCITLFSPDILQLHSLFSGAERC